MERVEIEFPSGDGHCGAWLYQPDGPRKPRPLVLMAPGLGTNREMGLDRYARRFAAAGMGVLLFDYRHFGNSSGQPRQLVKPSRQRDDWRAAITFARTLRGFDATRIALWGTSASGGHVLRIAAEDDYVAAVVTQVPLLSGRAAVRRKNWVSLLRVSARALADVVFRKVSVRVAGRRRSNALISGPNVLSGFGKLAEESEGYRSRVPARSALSLPWENAGRKASGVKVPVLYSLCDDDRVFGVKPALRAAAATKHATVQRYAGGHFDIYFGALFDQVVHDQTEFLVAVLRP